MKAIIKNSIFLAACAGVGLYSVINTPYSALDLSPKAAIRGEVSQTLETRFESALPVKEFGINLWSAIRYVIFNAGENGVVVGRNGWLFTDEEFYAPEEAQENLLNNLKTIAQVNDSFTRLGVELVIVPVPSKARIRNDKLQQQPDAIHRNLYTIFLSFLTAQGIPHVDTKTVFQQSGGDIFFKSDTHWLPEAAALAAQELAAAYGDSQAPRFEIAGVEQSTLRGDLTNYVPMEPWFRDIAPQEDALLTVSVVATATELDLFAELPPLEVALVGTSYSANPRWNFEGALKLALNRDVVNFAQEGEGPIAPMLNFLESSIEDLPALELVVWEIPERYLVQEYPTDLPQHSAPSTTALANNTNI